MLTSRTPTDCHSCGKPRQLDGAYDVCHTRGCPEDRRLFMQRGLFGPRKR